MPAMATTPHCATIHNGIATTTPVSNAIHSSGEAISFACVTWARCMGHITHVLYWQLLCCLEHYSLTSGVRCWCRCCCCWTFWRGLTSTNCGQFALGHLQLPSLHCKHTHTCHHGGSLSQADMQLNSKERERERARITAFRAELELAVRRSTNFICEIKSENRRVRQIYWNENKAHTYSQTGKDDQERWARACLVLQWWC